jgi:hypothetical protein
MTDEYARLYTIEHYSSKGWQVVFTCEGLHDAVQKLRLFCAVDGDLQQYRLTTPER